MVWGFCCYCIKSIDFYFDFCSVCWKMPSLISWFRDALFKWRCGYSEAFKAAGNSWIEMVNNSSLSRLLRSSWTSPEQPLSYFSFFFLLHLFYLQFLSCLRPSSALRAAPDYWSGSFYDCPINIRSTDTKNLCEIIYSFISFPIWTNTLLWSLATPTDDQGVCCFASLMFQLLPIRLSR